MTCSFADTAFNHDSLQICYTEDDRIQTRVSAEVIDPSTGQLSLTNVFQYTFSTKDAVAVPSIIPKVLQFIDLI
jgi:hypothetical protein